MGIIYTGDPIVTNVATLSNRASGINFLDAILRSAGMTATGITNGYRYVLESRQGLKARLDVWDPLSGSDIYLRMLSYDGLTVPTYYRKLRCDGSQVRAYAERCQFWILKPGLAGDETLAAFNFAGGVPFVFDLADCTEAWWYSGPGFRTGYRQTLTDYARNGCCWNGAFLENSFTASLYQSLQLVLLELPVGVYETPSVTKFWNGDPLYYEPLISWGEVGVLGRLRAQIPSAVFRSVAATLDTVIPFDGKQLYVYSAEAAHGSLCLLTGYDSVGVGGGYAY